jgi:4-alpha-glucanotransferase/(1->4)-alpha-D-glucan 1-alpha-D-glucosylmutase
MMVINQEDLTKDPDQQNLPGSTAEYPNWRHKMIFTLDELRTVQQARDCTAMVRGWLERSGRLLPESAAAPSTS